LLTCCCSTTRTMDVLVSGYTHRAQRIYRMRKGISDDVAGLILAFYMYDLSAHDYIAVFLNEETNSGHLSAFSLRTAPISRSKNPPPQKIVCGKPGFLKEQLGTTVKVFKLQQFPDATRNALFPKYQHIPFSKNENDGFHVVVRIEGENREAPYLCTAYCIETDDVCVLPYPNTSIDRCGLLQSQKHGLVAIGGYDFRQIRAFKHVQVLKSQEEVMQMLFERQSISYHSGYGSSSSSGYNVYNGYNPTANAIPFGNQYGNGTMNGYQFGYQSGSGGYSEDEFDYRQFEHRSSSAVLNSPSITQYPRIAGSPASYMTMSPRSLSSPEDTSNSVGPSKTNGIHDASSEMVWVNNVIPDMHTERSNVGVTMIEDEGMIFVCGGWVSAHIGDTNSTEVYSLRNDTIGGLGTTGYNPWGMTRQWHTLASMNTSHLCHGMCYDSNSKHVFVLGGTRHYQAHECELFNFERNRWYRMPSTLFPHKWFPSLKMQSPKMMICCGNHYNFDDGRVGNGWGESEFLDLREHQKAWHVLDDQMFHILGYQGVTRCEHKMRGIFAI